MGELEAHFRDDDVSIVERGVVEVDEYIVVIQLRDICLFVELEAIEAIFANYVPLLGG